MIRADGSGTDAEMPVVGEPRPRLPLRRDADDTDYAQRTFLNLLATVFLLVIAAGIVWTFQALDAQERLQRCLDTGKRDCVQLAPPRLGVRVVPDH
jgi:hypothetical protein